jgi:hypothetical protein
MVAPHRARMANHGVGFPLARQIRAMQGMKNKTPVVVAEVDAVDGDGHGFPIPSVKKRANFWGTRGYGDQVTPSFCVAFDQILNIAVIRRMLVHPFIKPFQTISIFFSVKQFLRIGYEFTGLNLKNAFRKLFDQHIFSCEFIWKGDPGFCRYLFDFHFVSLKMGHPNGRFERVSNTFPGMGETWFLAQTDHTPSTRKIQTFPKTHDA